MAVDALPAGRDVSPLLLRGHGQEFSETLFQTGTYDPSTQPPICNSICQLELTESLHVRQTEINICSLRWK